MIFYVFLLMLSGFTRSLSLKPQKLVVIRRFATTMSTTTSPLLLGLREFGKRGDNSFITYLKEDTTSSDPRAPRQIFHAHYTKVKPEPVPTPSFIAASTACAVALGLDPKEIDRDQQAFANAFAGNDLLPGLDDPYCSNYGCHCYGTYFGQLGDPRSSPLTDFFQSSSYLHTLPSLMLSSLYCVVGVGVDVGMCVWMCMWVWGWSR